MHPNPYVQEAYETDPNLQVVYNSIEEVTAKYPHIKSDCDMHRVRVSNRKTVRFWLNVMPIDVREFSFTVFVFFPE